MRGLHCNVLRLLLVALSAWPAAALAQTPATSTLRVFVRGAQVGTEEVTVERTATGILVSGSGRLAPPTDVITSRCEVRYDAEWRPIDAAADSVIRGVALSLRARFAGGAATVQIEEAGKYAARTDKVGPDDVVVLSSFFGLYEALAGRLQNAKPGARLTAYVVADREAAIQFESESQESIQTPGRTLAVRRFALSITSGDQPPMPAELWADQAGRMVRFVLPTRAVEVVRDDVASVAAHRDTARREGDERVRIQANGFSLGATISRPQAAKTGGRSRFPAVVLVSGGGATDRDEVASGIPVFAQLASALADAGFLVVRYDKRAVGESGGRSDHATLDDYADDAKAAAAYARRRKDVEAGHVALVGYGEGGWVAMLAAARNKEVAALALVATPGVSGSDLILVQQERLLDRPDISPADRQAKIDLQKKIHKAVITGTGLDDLGPAVRRQVDNPWFRSFLMFDPASVMPKVRQSLLILQGDLDREVFPSQAGRLADLAHRRKSPANKAVTVVHVPGINHLLAAARTGETDEYARLADRNVSRDAVAPLVSWLQMTLSAGKP